MVPAPGERGKRLALNSGFHYREQIDNRGSGLTVLAFLTGKYRHSTQREWQERIDRGEVFLDGRHARSDSVLRNGQRLLWRRPPWEEPDVPLEYSILHKDDDLLAVAKPSGLQTVPAGGFLEHTLLALVRAVFPEAAPIHRLGRGTSGIVLFARTPRARSVLCAAMRQNTVSKVYRALVSGLPAEDGFSITTPIGPVPHSRLGCVYGVSPGGKRALSRVVVLERRHDTSLLEVAISTGRPHQIRIHLASAGFPLTGDPLYAAGGGFRDPNALPGDSGYLLHAQRLCFRHPATNEILEIVCPPPPMLCRRGEAPALIMLNPGNQCTSAL